MSSRSGKPPRPPPVVPDDPTLVRPPQGSDPAQGFDESHETVMLPRTDQPARAPYPSHPPPSHVATGPQPFVVPHASTPPMQHAPQPTARSQPPEQVEEPPTSSGRRGPTSFSRLFLGNIEKYRGKTGEIGSASQEAAADLARRDSPDERRAAQSTLGLRSPLALVEAVVLTLILPGIGWLIDHQDPFFLHHGFPWILAAPLLLGLRHGFAPALTSAVLLDGLMAAAWRSHRLGMDALPGETMIGLTALAMITGQFSDVWKREIVRLDGGFEVLRKQLGELMRAHFLLELSHDRIEERVGRGTPNLRDALVAVQRTVAGRPIASIADIADAIADVFATYTMVEVGSVHRIEDGRVVVEPVAKIGRPAPLDPNDAQVKEALATKRLTYIRGGASVESGMTRTKLLAVVPFVDSKSRFRGMLAIESIPLLAFERRNLEALALLGGRFADALAYGGKAEDIQRGQRKEFRIRLRRALRDLVENDVASTIYVLLVRRGSTASDSIETMLGGSLRALDFPYIQRAVDGNYVIYILLPLTDEAGARAFSARLERIVRREGNVPLARSGAFGFHHVLRPEDTVDGVLGLLENAATLDEGSVEHTIVV
jgi:polysaccharide biosynthesis protein PelD